MLEAVKFPARITNLDTGLTNVNTNALSHFVKSELNRRDIYGKFREMKMAFIKTPISFDSNDPGGFWCLSPRYYIEKDVGVFNCG